jgi:hypothetical protein
MEKNFVMEIAAYIGEPINTQLPVPVELSAIADTITIEPGEKVYKYSTTEDTADVILAVDAAGAITVVKRDPVGVAEVSLSGLNSKLEYVLIDAVLAAADTDVLSRRRESIMRGMDKREVKAITDAIYNKTAGYLPGKDPFEVTPVSGDDLYDVIVAMKHKVEDYGDGYVLLVASDVKEAIDNFDKTKAGTFMNGLSLTKKLEELKIEVIKMFGKVSSASNEAEVAMFADGQMILVAKNSRLAEGKPIKFVRRKISPDIAKLMGADVTNAQRATIVNPTPVNVAGTNTLAYGVYGYESIVFVITNPYALCICDASTVI